MYSKITFNNFELGCNGDFKSLFQPGIAQPTVDFLLTKSGFEWLLVDIINVYHGFAYSSLYLRNLMIKELGLMKKRLENLQVGIKWIPHFFRFW